MKASSMCLARKALPSVRVSHAFRIARTLLSAGFGLGSLCCAAAVDGVPLGEDDVTSSIEQELAVDVTVTRWPSTVPLCLSLIHISEPTRLLSISYAVFCL